MSQTLCLLCENVKQTEMDSFSYTQRKKYDTHIELKKCKTNLSMIKQKDKNILCPYFDLHNFKYTIWYRVCSFPTQGNFQYKTPPSMKAELENDFEYLFTIAVVNCCCCYLLL